MRYIIGIDLGTTNNALAYLPVDAERAEVQTLAIPQLVAPGTVEPLPTLASFLYLPAEHERGGDSFMLPWKNPGESVVGELARKQAADVPARTVTSAKSWLAHTRVDRHQPILPYNAPPDVNKVSPVEAARRYLQHLVAAWEAAFPDAPIAQQQVVLTVPASFDASARELTREAALAAGLPESMILLEEPQAAVYAWLADQGERWRRQLKVGDTLLVCDVGGGTTDFTLIRVDQEAGDLVLRRVAVGNHILVGGDNMDLALAHRVSQAFAAKGVPLDPWQSVSLWHSCRLAKETLLGEGGPKKHPVTVLGRGSKLIKGTVSVDVQRAEASEQIVEGFFPLCKLTDRPAPRRAAGFRELGLPFETDTAITRHLAAFLSAHGENGEPVRPTHVLFNGGVFKSDVLRQRVFEVLGNWFKKGTAPQGLEGNRELDLAVARGAAHYGLAQQGRGVRIRGGTARSYYLGVETAGLAIPGVARPINALCVVPFGMEEGTETEVPGEELGLVVGEQASFRFFSSAVRKQDRPGEVLRSWTDEELTETDPLEATLPPAPDIEDAYVPVRLHSKITELGIFELWCVSTAGEGRWKLEFSVRPDADHE
jgi:molecular chaperone DnaK (HSP70)